MNRGLNWGVLGTILFINFLFVYVKGKHKDKNIFIFILLMAGTLSVYH